jgi:hypothetical protein
MVPLTAACRLFDRFHGFVSGWQKQRYAKRQRADRATQSYPPAAKGKTRVAVVYALLTFVMKTPRFITGAAPLMSNRRPLRPRSWPNRNERFG